MPSASLMSLLSFQQLSSEERGYLRVLLAEGAEGAESVINAQLSLTSLMLVLAVIIGGERVFKPGLLRKSRR